MSKPTVNVTWSTGSGVIVEPSSGEKAAGMDVGEKFPAQWFNFLFNGIWQWVVWLAGYEDTAHTWTALQSFGAGVAAGGADGSHGVVDAQGTSTKPAVYGLAGTGTTGAGVFGQGANRTTFGNSGVLGVGGNGTASSSVGGQGAVFQGGTGAGAAGISGNGASATAGAVDGTVNTTGSAGSGAVFKGGDITSDANGRVGGDGVTATAGHGQGGYGKAFHAVHGDIDIDDGNLNVSGVAAVVGVLNALAAANVYGLFSAIGGIDLEGVTNVTGFATHYATGATYAMACWKDPLGFVGFEGSLQFVTGATDGDSILATPLNARFWPLKNAGFVVGTDAAGKTITLTVLTDGYMIINLASGFAIGGTFITPVSAIRYRTT